MPTEMYALQSPWTRFSNTSDGGGAAAGCPYVTAMQDLLVGLPVLPQITNALLFASIFSASDNHSSDLSTAGVPLKPSEQILERFAPNGLRSSPAYLQAQR